MNILYVTSSFDKKGSASVRNISLVNGLVEIGVNVDVLTQSWPDYMVDHDLRSKINNNVNIYYDSIKAIDLYFSKIKSLQNRNKKNKKIITLVKNIIKYLYYFPDIDKEWIKNYNKNIDFKKYDLIISSSDTKTSHFVANKIIKVAPNAKWFQIWGDPWVDDKGTTGFRKVIAYFYEKWLLKKGDKIFYTSLPTLNAMKTKYKRYSHKMHYLKRSYLIEIKGKNRKKEVYIFSYIGSIYYGRNIMPLIESIDEYNRRNKKKIILNIYGTYSDKLMNDCRPYNFVNFCGYIEYNSVVDVISNSDVLVFMSNMKDSHQIPGKLYDYFGSDRTILALMESLDSPVADFIRQTNRCIIFENDKNQIDLDIVVNQILQNNQQILTEYSKKTVARELLNFMKECEMS